MLAHVLDEDLCLVTNNWMDFRPMVERIEVHPGIVVILPSVRRERQMELFAVALAAIGEHEPPLDMINTVIEVDAQYSRDIHHSVCVGFGAEFPLLRMQARHLQIRSAVAG